MTRSMVCPYHQCHRVMGAERELGKLWVKQHRIPGRLFTVCPGSGWQIGGVLMREIRLMEERAGRLGLPPNT